MVRLCVVDMSAQPPSAIAPARAQEVTNFRYMRVLPWKGQDGWSGLARIRLREIPEERIERWIRHRRGVRARPGHEVVHDLGTRRCGAWSAHESLRSAHRRFVIAESTGQH